MSLPYQTEGASITAPYIEQDGVLLDAESYQKHFGELNPSSCLTNSSGQGSGYLGYGLELI